ncbi:MAG: nitroreductase family protein [Acidimicrobiales bacterium]
MQLIDALRTTPTVRHFSPEPVGDDVVFQILDDARFAPSGGNRQAWRVIVVHDPTTRRAVRDAYLDAWHDYVAHLLAGLIPFSPLASDEDRALALSLRTQAEQRSTPDGFPETLDLVPVMLVICADLTVLAATDRDLDRYQIAGGASIYPFVWNILLAARERGLGGVITTVAMRREEAVRRALNIPDTFAVASVVALGHPTTHVTKLSRRRVETFTTVDTFNGAPFEG